VQPPALPVPPSETVAPDSVWETVAGPYIYSDGPVADQDGNIYFAVTTQNKIYSVTPAGELRLFDEDTALTMGLRFGPAGRLLACRNQDAQIVAYDMQGNREVLLQGELTVDKDAPDAPAEFCNDLAVNSAGGIWFTDRVNQTVVYLDSSGQARIVASGFRSNGIVLSADEGMLVLTDSYEPRLWAFRVLDNGVLEDLAGFFEPVVLPKKKSRSKQQARPGTNGMTIDERGRFYVTTFSGIQVYAPDGKSLGLIKTPAGYISSVAFGGEDFEYLYATGRQGIYRIPMLTHGVGYAD
jgi:gluconolactonase